MQLAILWTCLAFVVAVLALLARQDWPHLTRRSRAVTGTVTAHKAYRSDGLRRHVAVIGFPDEDGAWIEIEDQLLSATPDPPVGARVALRHPSGRPQLARVRRPWLRPALYALLLFLAAILAGRLMGWLSTGAGGS